MIQDRYRKQSLIFFSLFFYAYYDVSGAVHFAIFVLITYIASILLVKTNYSKLVLGCSITALVFYLMYYKYLNFLLHNLQRFFGVICQIKCNSNPLPVTGLQVVFHTLRLCEACYS